MTKTVFITGATSGIGKATAELLAKKGHHLIICGRRKERLEEMHSVLSKHTAVHTLNFDVRDKESVFQEINSLPATFKTIDILINNAGNAHGMNTIHEGDTNDWDAMIDINVKGLLYVSRAILPDMVRRREGHIINIGSIAGKEIYPNGNVYCASKYAVDALSSSMRVDLNQYGIKVSEVNPGAVETEFSLVRFKGNQQAADKVYDGFQPLTAGDVAEVIEFVISRPKHVNLADAIILPNAQASATVFNRNN